MLNDCNNNQGSSFGIKLAMNISPYSVFCSTEYSRRGHVSPQFSRFHSAPSTDLDIASDLWDLRESDICRELDEWRR
jgi:hypothetical protein